MKSRIANLVSILLLVSSMLLVSQSTPVLAYSSAPVDMSAPDYQAEGADTIGFDQIRPTDIQLIGPYDETSLVYGLPADWSLNGSPTLNLELSVAISSLSGFVANDIDSQVISVGGTLTVVYNREVVETFPFTQNGDFTKTVQIPLELTKSVRDDGRQELVFVLDSGFSCLLNQQMIVTVHTSSNITYPHTSVLPETNLARYPFPIYQGSIFSDQALIVLPDKPTAEELQSAMIISAGLGKLSNLRMALDLTTAGKLTTEQTLSQNLILVGKGSEFSILDELPLPMPVTSGKFQTQAERVDDGIVQMVNSPWNKGRVVLVVSGDTNAAVIKSAKALSSGVLRSNTSSNLSIVQDVQAEIQNMLSKNDVTLAELGYENAMLEGRGVDVASFRFFVPSGTTLNPDAYFEMFFGNSALLDFARSGLVVQVNGQPVGSVRFSETTAAEAMNRLQINIPSSVVISGTNTLDVVSSLQPIDNCSAPNLRGLWATIWSDSRLHIPLIPSLTVATPVLSLSDFPAPFVFDSSLGNTAFVLQRDDLESWSSALVVASYLGERSDGAILSLNTYFADDIPESERADKNFIVMGLAPQMPIMTELNELLPAPFESQSGIATENNMQVTFRIPANSPVGYVELLQSPWNKNNIIIVAVGNLRQGTSWAIASLYTSSLRSRLAGNFAVINDQQVITTDTRISIPQIAISSTAFPDLSLIPPVVDTTTPIAIKRPAWILPALLFAIGMVVLILSVVIINLSRHNKKGHPTPAPVEKSKEENME